MSEDKNDFVVRDRRIFSEENQDAEESTDNAEMPSENGKEAEDAHAQEDTDEEPCLPKINFATFIFSLHSSVILHLGLLEDPGTGKKTKNLTAAKQTIDIMGMLEEKTRGNLTQEEEGMLKNILYDLRMLYVKEKE